MDYIYTVVDENGQAYPIAFTCYADALNEVIRVQDHLRDTEGYDDWRENELNKVNVEECHKINKKNNRVNETELYIEKGIFITIYRLELKR
jgi:predicted small metal-binding protein